MLYLPSLASISRQDIAGNSGMEPKGTEKIKSVFDKQFRSSGSLHVISPAQKSLSMFVIASLSLS